MSNIDKRALREAAEKATPGNWWIDSHGQAMVSFIGNDVLEVFTTDNKRSAVRHEDTGNLSRWRNDNDATFIATADPVTVLTLLDELEAKDKQIAELTESLKQAVSGYKSCLRTGHDRILDLGGDCDEPEVMISGNPDIQQAEKLLAAAAGKGEAL